MPKPLRASLPQHRRQCKSDVGKSDAGKFDVGKFDVGKSDVAAFPL